MNADDIQQYKKKLEDESKDIEESLKGFAKKDPAVPDDWDTTFPSFGAAQSPEENADAVEDYENKVGVEHELELRLREIEMALEKINLHTFGVCEKCGKEIEKERLMANPEAKLCEKCME
jgi:RNA polymerase-binding transcription factor DksA